MSRSALSAQSAPSDSALEIHVRRYGHDLAYLMNRLDAMDKIMHEQEIMISKAVLWLSNLEEKYKCPVAATRPEALKSEMRGQCRIIQFSKMV